MLRKNAKRQKSVKGKSALDDLEEQKERERKEAEERAREAAKKKKSTFSQARALPQ